jgi:hypothetical protein
MNHPFLVRHMHAIHHPLKQPDPFPDGELALLRVFHNGKAFDELHRKVGNPASPQFHRSRLI